MSFNCIPTLSSESLSDYKLVSEAAMGGIFYFAVPNEWEKQTSEALKFCYQFPCDNEIKKYTDGKFGGYHQRDLAQIESFYIEKKDWNKILSPSLQELAVKMDILAKDILDSILKISGIPKEMWNEATGNLVDGKGQNHFSFNHYRSDKDTVGIKEHLDFGFVSILYIEKDGLEVYHEGKWKEVKPSADHLIVILGKALGILINDVKKVSAAWHRVRHLSEERASFAITCDSDENLPVLRHIGGQLETVYPCYSDYLKECFKEAYEPEGF